MQPPLNQREMSPTNVDIIILSYAKTPALRSVTETCISSLLDSENRSTVVFNVLVIESQKDAPPYAGEGVKTIYPREAFGYHAYMNIGIRQTASNYVCLCNNDLYFHTGWASAILRAFSEPPELQSASPLCTKHHPSTGICPHSGLLVGYEIRREVAGWCLFFRRDMLAVTGLLDETFKFWFADNDYARTVEKHRLLHALVTDSFVDHLESQTLQTEGEFRRRLLTRRAKIEFNRKWNHLSGWTYWRKVTQCNLKLAKCFVKGLFAGSPRR